LQMRPCINHEEAIQKMQQIDTLIHWTRNESANPIPQFLPQGSQTHKDSHLFYRLIHSSKIWSI
jgi:hypothetical protein